jgi:hypothetical protein
MSSKPSVCTAAAAGADTMHAAIDATDIIFFITQPPEWIPSVRHGQTAIGERG